YAGTFAARTSGTAGRRIALCGSPAAVLRGPSYTTGYGFHLNASHWTLHGFTVTHSQSGVAVMGGSHNVLDGLTVEGTGHEGVRFQVFSSHNVLRNSRIRNTGLQVAEYGEGLYV